MGTPTEEGGKGNRVGRPLQRAWVAGVSGDGLPVAMSLPSGCGGFMLEVRQHHRSIVMRDCVVFGCNATAGEPLN